MNKTERDEARELLQLEAKLVRLRIEASYLKQRKLKEQEERKSDTLMKLLDLGNELTQTLQVRLELGLTITQTPCGTLHLVVGDIQIGHEGPPSFSPAGRREV